MNDLTFAKKQIRSISNRSNNVNADSSDCSDSSDNRISSDSSGSGKEDAISDKKCQAGPSLKRKRFRKFLTRSDAVKAKVK